MTVRSRIFHAPSALALALTLAAAPAAFAQDTAPADTAAASPATTNQIVVTGHAAIGDFGLDLTAGDPEVKPGDDFEKYASGAWLAKTKIPADRASTGTFNNLYEGVQAELQKLIINAPADSKYGKLYRAFMDEKAIERAGLKPLMADLEAVKAIRDKGEFAKFMGGTNGKFGIDLFGYGVGSDTENPDINVLYMGQGGLGLPNRDYYLKPEFAKQRAAYSAYIVRTMKAIGTPDPRAAAETIMAFETYVAQLSWEPDQQRQIELLNNPYSTAQFEAYAPGVDWNQYFTGAGIAPQKRLIAGENSAIKALAGLYDSTPLETLKLWQEFHIASQASPYLTKAMVDSRFQFTSSLSGVTAQRPRWKRAVSMVDGSLGELVGEAYVAKYFPPSAKAKMEDLVANLKLAMADRIKGNTWMSPSTKQAALDKLAKMTVMVGYPDKWRDYSGLAITDSLYADAQAAGKFDADYQMSFLGKPVDRTLWAMNPQTVNAYNGGLENKIVFPAGILQPPFFDPAADPAVNYGAVGAVIGHEISHGFDDQGRKIDANGAVHDWWTAEDAKRFDAKAKEYGAEFAAYHDNPGIKINPELTMGENIADLAGMTVALDAYHRSLDGKPAPVIGGLTGDQRFFLSWAQVWRTKQREDAMKNQVATDPHSPARYRTLTAMRNIDDWYKAFDIKPGDAMYIPPDKRVRIW